MDSPAVKFDKYIFPCATESKDADEFYNTEAERAT